MKLKARLFPPNVEAALRLVTQRHPRAHTPFARRRGRPPLYAFGPSRGTWVDRLIDRER